MNIAKILTPRPLTAVTHADNSIRQGLEILKRRGFTAIPVLDAEDRYIGSVSEGDIMRYMLSAGTADPQQLEKETIGRILRKDFCSPLRIVAAEEDVIASVLRQNFVPIVDDRGCLCGIVTRRSVLIYLAEKAAGEVPAAGG